MGTRKNRKSKKSNKRFRKTRSKRQRGGEDTPTIAELTAENEALQHQVAELSTCGDCAICQEPMDNKCSKVNLLIATDCNHIFHKDCLRIWCQNKANTTCPNCRTPIPNTCTYLSSTNILPRAATSGAEDAERRPMIASTGSSTATATELWESWGRGRAAAEDTDDSDAGDPDDSDAYDPDNTRVPYNNTRNTGNQLNVIEQNYNQAFGRVPTGPRRPKKSGRGSGRSGGKKRTKKTKRRSRK